MDYAFQINCAEPFFNCEIEIQSRFCFALFFIFLYSLVLLLAFKFRLMRKLNGYWNSFFDFVVNCHMFRLHINISIVIVYACDSNQMEFFIFRFSIFASLGGVALFVTVIYCVLYHFVQFTIQLLTQWLGLDRQCDISYKILFDVRTS